MDSTSLNQNINLDEDDEMKISKSNQGSSKKNKEFSDAWNYFVKKEIGQDGVQRTECKGM